MKSKYKDLLINLVIQINENISEVSERKLFADEKELDYIEGKLMAYKEILAIIKLDSKEQSIDDFF